MLLITRSGKKTGYRRYLILLAAVFCLMMGTSRVFPVPEQPVPTVMIDPGHGGNDTGAGGAEGVWEKDVNLALARLLAAALSEKGYRALLTRTGDYHIDIFDRTAKANRAAADLFVSLHTGGGFSRQRRAAMIFHVGRDTHPFQHSGLSDEDRPGRKGPEVCWEEVNKQHFFASQAAARDLQKTLAGADEVFIRELPLAVLEGAAMPAVLIEIGSLVNPGQEKKLQTPEDLSVIADRLCQGIIRFLKDRRP